MAFTDAELCDIYACLCDDDEAQSGDASAIPDNCVSAKSDELTASQLREISACLDDSDEDVGKDNASRCEPMLTESQLREISACLEDSDEESKKAEMEKQSSTAGPKQTFPVAPSFLTARGTSLRVSKTAMERAKAMLEEAATAEEFSDELEPTKQLRSTPFAADRSMSAIPPSPLAFTSASFQTGSAVSTISEVNISPASRRRPDAYSSSHSTPILRRPPVAFARRRLPAETQSQARTTILPVNLSALGEAATSGSCKSFAEVGRIMEQCLLPGQSLSMEAMITLGRQLPKDSAAVFRPFVPPAKVRKVADDEGQGV